jgi:chemotaxis signal transduction protein
LPLDDVRSIVEIDAARPAPAVHPAVLGVMAVADGFLPLVALAGLVGGDADHPPDVAVVARCGAALVALAVDDVEEVVHGQFHPVPKEWEHAWASAVARDARGLVPLVDLTAVAAQLTPDEAEVNDAE